MQRLLAKTSAVAMTIYAWNLAWFRHRLNDAEAIELSAKTYAGFTLGIPWAFVLLISFITVEKRLQLNETKLALLVVGLVIAVIFNRYLDRFFLAHESSIEKIVDRVTTNPKQGPAWALKMAMLTMVAELTVFGLLFIYLI